MKVVIELLLLLVTFSATKSLPIDLFPSASRVINGFKVDIVDVPYQAAIRRKVSSSGWAYICGATVISERSALTAAHCAINYIGSPSDLRVLVGTDQRLSGGKTYPVSKVHVHESYNTFTYENDIALLVTLNEINFGPTVSSIPYAPRNLVIPSGSEALVTGFGRTLEDGSISPILLAAVVKITSQSNCTRAYQEITKISTGMICASATNPPRDACQGDSGGPLVAYGYLIGIVSWGEGCANARYPGVYTRVSEYNSWIRKKMEKIYYRNFN